MIQELDEGVGLDTVMSLHHIHYIGRQYGPLGGGHCGRPVDRGAVSQGVCLEAIRRGEYERPLLVTVTRATGGDGAGEIALVALRTPPHNLILCVPADLEAVEALVDELASDIGPEDLPGVLGPADAALAFAKAWSARTGRAARLAVDQRIYRCAEVDPPTDVPGELRVVTDADRPLLRNWVQEFHDEALPDMPFDAEAQTNRWLRPGPRSLYFWQVDGEIVSMVGAAGPTPNGIRIVAVYTPPEHRKRGYASAAVAELTQRLLDDDRAFCVLFTDLANPTSNKIYQQIGYRIVLDFPLYAFGAVEPREP